MKHIVCYSGGHSSALVAIEVVRKYGQDSVVLLNHDIHPNIEDADIKRFKREVSEYLHVPITYANHPHWSEKDQFDVCIDAKAFRVVRGQALCTNRLKTQPFDKWLNEFVPDKNCVIYYGFDAGEKVRIQRRSQILGMRGYKSDYPLALWNVETERTIFSTRDVGIEPPLTYGDFKHANCKGCLKASKQHWYIVFCNYPEIWNKAKHAEEVIGYSIMNDYLEDVEDMFSKMKCAGIRTTEHEDPRTFFARVRRQFKDVNDDGDTKPCECVF